MYTTENNNILDNILVTIFNHNVNENAISLLNLFSRNFETIVLDSGSDNPSDLFIKLENIYYNGLFNESVRLLNEKNKEWLMLITSDILIDEFNYEKMTNKLLNENMFSDIGVYSPSSTIESRSHAWCKNKGTGNFREVMFAEGYFSMINKTVLNKIAPIDLQINKLGWLTDILCGYYSRKENLKCVIDDDIFIFHPDGTGYSDSQANAEMYSHINKINNSELNLFIRNSFNQN